MASFSAACPVCSRGVYIDAAAPMATAGSVNPAKHSCLRTDTWRQRNRFGGSVARLRQRLLETPAEELAAWPQVAALRRRAEAGGPLS